MGTVPQEQSCRKYEDDCSSLWSAPPWPSLKPIPSSTLDTPASTMDTPDTPASDTPASHTSDPTSDPPTPDSLDTTPWANVRPRLKPSPKPIPCCTGPPTPVLPPLL